MNSNVLLNFILILINVSNVADCQDFISSEACRSRESKLVHPNCTIRKDLASRSKCISEGVVLLYWDNGLEENETIFCSASFPIEIVLNFHNNILSDDTLDFPEFERTVEKVSEPSTYIYHIRIPYGFITRRRSDVKSFVIRSVQLETISTSFVHRYDTQLMLQEIVKSERMESVIQVRQEIISLPCPIHYSANYPNGIHRIQPNSNGTSTRVNLLNLFSEYGRRISIRNYKDKGAVTLESAFYANNIPVDDTRLLWDPINGFRFNISNWIGMSYSGQYFCTSGYNRNEIVLTNNFTLIEFEGVYGKPDSSYIGIASFSRTTNITLECTSTKKIEFRNSFSNTGALAIVKNWGSIENRIFHIVYHLSLNSWNESDRNAALSCFDTGSQTLVRAWSILVIDIRADSSYPFWIGADGAKAKCGRAYSGSDKCIVPHLTCRNIMECEMVKFCIIGAGSCPSIVRSGSCTSLEYQRYVKSPENGILACSTRQYGLLSVTYFKGFDGLIYADWIEAPIPALIQLEVLDGPIFYSSTWLVISCKGHRMLTGGLIQWILEFKDSSWIHVPDTSQTIKSVKTDPIVKAENQEDGIKSTLHLYLENINLVGVTCMVPVWNSDQWVNMTRKFEIIEPSKPKIKTVGTNKAFRIGSKDQSLVCDVESDPVSNLTWTRLGFNSNNQNFIISRKVNLATLHFPEFSANSVGNYVCMASNLAGNDSKVFHVSIDEGTRLSWLYAVLVFLLILLAISVIFVFWIRRNLLSAKRADAQTQINYLIAKFLNGFEDDDSNPDKYPYSNEFEIPMEELTIDRTHVLGAGAFGIVYRGKINGRSGTVAVKTLQQRQNYDVEHFQSLLSELRLLMFIGKHPYIVKLVGAITQQIHSGEFYIVSEECVGGNLQNFLRSKRHQIGPASATSVRYLDLINDDWKAEQKIELLNDLTKWSYQIADAMEFIASKNVIHSDLASRNILLSAEKNAKITDFGLSRKLYNYVQYVKKKNEPLPWAWMSIEALRDMAFSTKSDVWSYGVLLWEMYSFAAVPYGGMNWDPGFVQKLKGGLRLPKPELATDSIYDVMKDCWSNKPANRPEFASLKQAFENNLTRH